MMAAATLSKWTAGLGVCRRFSSVDAGEVAKFSALVDEWWDPQGRLRALHTLNPIRTRALRRAVEQTPPAGFVPQASRRPLLGLSILDVGCGGGLLSEALARLGGRVTGIDAAEGSIQAARLHAAQDAHLGADLRYINTTAEGLVEKTEERFDIVVASEVLEHVDNPQDFIGTCSKLIKSEGLLFVSTLNRTLVSQFLAVYAAENILGLAPPGAHSHSKFVKPEELASYMRAGGLRVTQQLGIQFNPTTYNWIPTTRMDMNYFMIGRKDPPAPAPAPAPTESIRQAHD